MSVINVLIEEHKVLLQAIETSKRFQKIENDKTYYHIMHDLILFFRNFSEIYHYPKEEDILFPVLQNKANGLSSAVLNEICDNHDDFKSIMAEIENAYVGYDIENMRKKMQLYIASLEEHIRKENSVLLAEVKNILTPRELDEVMIAFEKFDEKIGGKRELMHDYHKISLKID